jgi:short-subunit dehydrogenase
MAGVRNEGRVKLRLKPLSQQVIVIVGASSGIGLSTARMAARRGARLVLAARSGHALHQLASEISATGAKAIAVEADVSVESDVVRVADEAARVFGGFDTWVNNAAVSAYGTCLDVSIADMRRIMDTNFWGVVYGSRVACGRLRRRGGALINLGSVLSDRAVPLQGVYSASKHAIKAWTDALRVELEADGAPVSVTLVKPSAIGTPYAEHAAKYMPDQPRHVPPVYSPSSVAEAILYAAEHPKRDITVGASGKVLELASVVAPRLTDAAMTRWLLPAFHSGEARRGRASIDAPSEDLRERGDYPGLVRPSLSTKLATHPAAGRILAALAVVAGSFLVSAARGLSTGPPGRAAPSGALRAKGQPLRGGQRAKGRGQRKG